MSLFNLKDVSLILKDTVILKKINLSILKSESTAIIGQSGAGKSSLARLICNLLKPNTGTIFYNNQNIKNLNKQEKMDYCKNVQMVFQNPTSSLNPMMTVRQILCEPLIIHKMAHSDTICVQYLKMVELDKDILHYKPHKLSGGQQQRLCLARALILKPKVLILDEVTCSLDLFTQAQIIKLLTKLKSHSSLTYIFISHDLALTDHVCQRFIVLNNKEIIDDFMTEDLFSEKRASYTKTLLKASLKLTSHVKSKPCMGHGEALLGTQNL